MREPLSLTVAEARNLLAVRDRMGVEIGEGDVFSRAVRGDADVPVSLEDTLKNMAVIDAIFRSGDSRKWETPKAE